jgi:hypothetical protein
LFPLEIVAKGYRQVISRLATIPHTSPVALP